jgi:hypothetical protein
VLAAARRITGALGIAIAIVEADAADKADADE